MLHVIISGRHDHLDIPQFLENIWDQKLPVHINITIDTGQKPTLYHKHKLAALLPFLTDKVLQKHST